MGEVRYEYGFNGFNEILFIKIGGRLDLVYRWLCIIFCFIVCLDGKNFRDLVFLGCSSLNIRLLYEFRRNFRFFDGCIF